MNDPQISKAATAMADLLATALLPTTGTWANARDLYCWERKALEWLRDHRGSHPISAWTAMLIEQGYPPKPFTDHRGITQPAGAYWHPRKRPRLTR